MPRAAGARALRLAAWLAGLLVSLGAGGAAAVDFEKLVMPGPVIQGHADIEGECSKCHSPFERQAQDSRCVACHEKIGADLAHHTGFHGKAPGVAKARCRDCHGEHEGREADIVGLDRAAFDHGQTDYPLHGAHARLACDSCHREGVAFRDAPGACVDCHRSDDAHAGKLGTDCAHCHEEAAWKQASFDHDRTKFPLRGEHRKAECGLCHPNQRFEGTPTDCNSCHRVDDAHAGRFGPDCKRCHDAQAWKPAHFDHALDGHFPLRGAHAPLACESCHVGGLERDLPRDCATCHRADDVHRGRRGTDCERCHSETTWKTEKFDHDRETHFPLRGSHRGIACDACHTGTLGREKLETSCVGCHRDDDVHRGQLGASCDACNGEKGWSEVMFEHDVTRFPLLGVHATTACEQCHTTRRFHDAALECKSCHAEDDIHVGRLGPDCGLCHNPNGWERWHFDHDRQTSFALRGAHEKLDCHLCHRAPPDADVPLLASCGGCHARDDRHGGGFGSDCARCHQETTWREVRIPR